MRTWVWVLISVLVGAILAAVIIAGTLNESLSRLINESFDNLDWIAVEDRRPKDQQIVVGRSDCGIDIVRCIKNEGEDRFGEVTFISQTGYSNGDVVYWMPIPEYIMGHLHLALEKIRVSSQRDKMP